MNSSLPQENPKEPLPFLEKPLKGTEPARCIDGRPCPTSPEGPQMLGGSVHPLVLKAISTNTELNKSTVRKYLEVLTKRGYAPGVHRGSNRNEKNGVCDCGFCDRLNEIVVTAQKNEAAIKERLNPLLKTSRLNPFLLNLAYDRIRSFRSDKIKSYGEPLLLEELTNGAICEIVEGQHSEEIAFINLRGNTTFDTRLANARGYQAFNLDLWMVKRQSQALGINPNFATSASLILYLATEMVLVEQKGNLPLPTTIHR